MSATVVPAQRFGAKVHWSNARGRRWLRDSARFWLRVEAVRDRAVPVPPAPACSCSSPFCVRTRGAA